MKAEASRWRYAAGPSYEDTELQRRGAKGLSLNGNDQLSFLYAGLVFIGLLVACLLNRRGVCALRPCGNRWMDSKGKSDRHRY